MGGKIPNGREKSLFPGGAPGRCEDAGAWWALRAWRVGEFSVLSAPCCSKGQQLHSAFYELEEIVELGKADCRHCFSLLHRIISSDYFFLVHFPLGCPEAVADAGVNRSVNFELFHPLLFPFLSYLSTSFSQSLFFQHLNKSQGLISHSCKAVWPSRNSIFIIVYIIYCTVR